MADCPEGHIKDKDGNCVKRVYANQDLTHAVKTKDGKSTVTVQPDDEAPVEREIDLTNITLNPDGMVQDNDDTLIINQSGAVARYMRGKRTTK